MTATGPYVVTHQRERTLAISDPRSEFQVLYREAFATLEEAQSAVYDRTREHVVPLKSRVPASGRTVGPLPDGSVIEVEATTYAALYDVLPQNARPSTLDYVTEADWRAHVLAAWKAEHGIGLGARA